MTWAGTLRRGCALLATLGMIGCRHAESARPEISQFFPALNLASVGSAPYRARDLEGRVVVVNFFATWCFPCLGQLGLLQKLKRQYADRGLEVVAIGMDLEGRTVLEPFQREYELPFPVLLASAPLREGKTAFGPISTLPASFVFGRDGHLLTVFAGLSTAEELDHLLARALTE